jgi:hypothetical protein
LLALGRQGIGERRTETIAGLISMDEDTVAVEETLRECFSYACLSIDGDRGFMVASVLISVHEVGMVDRSRLTALFHCSYQMEMKVDMTITYSTRCS